MSSVRGYFFVFLTLLGVISRFANCQSSNCNEESAPGSDTTHLSKLERIKKLFSSKPKDGNWCSFMDEMNQHGTLAPGTKWCGDGNKAKDKDDLGMYKDTDACCRDHDYCEYNIQSGCNLGNLLNNGLFTRSACLCDYEFYNCLKNVNSYVSSGVGKTYFNILGPQCFKCECPAEGCSLDDDDTGCINNTQCKKYKWVDNQEY